MGWFESFTNKIGDAVQDAAEDAAHAVVNTGQDLLEGSVDLVQSGKCYQTIDTLSKSSTRCYQLSRETSELCHTTQAKGHEMIAFGSDIQTTLADFDGKMDPNTLETIKDLMDGDKLREAMTLAQDMRALAVSCVEKSVEMAKQMENVLDSIPDVLERAMDGIAGRDDEASLSAQARSTGVLSTLDQDVEDVRKCIDNLQHLHLTSALTVGKQAFENLSNKATLSKTIFVTMKDFSDEVSSYTQAFSDGDVGDIMKLTAKLKDVWHCWKLTGLMRQLAEGAGKLIRIVIDLFHSMTDRLSSLWAALAYAKDCMVDCMEHVTKVKGLLLDAKCKSSQLIEHTRSIKTQIEKVRDLDKGSIAALSQLTQGREIHDSVAIATTMDDTVLECSEKVVSMVERVTEGFTNFPSIITGGMDLEEEGKQDDDPEVQDIEENLTKMQTSRDLIDTSDIITAAQASVDAYRNVAGNVHVIQEMLELCDKFTGNCTKTINSFLGVWELDDAMAKLTEMCRIVRVGELIKSFSRQIRQLLMAMVALMKSSIQKLSINNIDVGDLADAAKDKLHDAKEDAIDVVKGSIEKLQFWKQE
jgi:hypothetical protein